jgi:hypothetical protein
MGFAPKGGGEMLPYSFVPSEYEGINLNAESMITVQGIAHNFWERVASDARISEEFKEYLERGNPIDLARAAR